MNNTALSIVKVMVTLNLLAIFAFAALTWVVPLHTDLIVRMKYVQLDRENVINEDALQKFHPSYGFTTGSARDSVPRYIAGPALLAESRNAVWGFVLSIVNYVASMGLLFLVRRSTARQAPD